LFSISRPAFPQKSGDGKMTLQLSFPLEQFQQQNILSRHLLALMKQQNTSLTDNDHALVERLTRTSTSPFHQQRPHPSIHSNVVTDMIPDSSHSMMMTRRNNNAVYLGWIRHAATKTWRDVVKFYSQNINEYPSWSDDIHVLIQSRLREEHGIDTFFICRLNQNKRYMGTWLVATDQEILEQTKQRFLKDRQPPSDIVVTGAKRRGRAMVHEVSSNLLESDTTLEVRPIDESSYKKRKGNTSCTEQRGHAQDDGMRFLLKPRLPKSAVEVKPSHLSGWNRGLEQMERYVRKQAEPDMAHSDDFAKSITEDEDSSVTSPYNCDKTTDITFGQLPPSKTTRSNSNNETASKRKPWFPILPNHVCLEWKHHPGTIKWREVVKTLSRNSSVWTDDMVNLAKEKLAEENFTVFLVFLDLHGKPCLSIKHGLWYLASEKEVLEKTKQQLLRERIHSQRYERAPWF
jgi:hypothetical protein